MGRKDWAQMDSMNEIATISANRGRGWRIFSGVLLVGAATFAAAYYLPLYRAHAALTGKYRTLSQEATTQHQQLTETIDTLKQVAGERDQLSALARKKQETASSQSNQLDSLERELQKQLKKYMGPGKLQLERNKDKIQFTLGSPALVANTGNNLTEAGKSVVCVIGAAAKSANLGVRVHAPAVSAANKNTTDWLPAALRAGNTVQLLESKCGIEPNSLLLQVTPPSSKLTAPLIMDIATTE
jgi:hypothetical protein